LIIETYLDASRLSSSQSLVIVDEDGKRWDALEALNTSESWSDGDSSPGEQQQPRRNTEVILERWRVELKCIPPEGGVYDEFGPTLPTIYKRSIVFFRSLFVTTRVMPCWKYSQQALAKGVHPALEVKCRILTQEPGYAHGGYDQLRQPLIDGRDAVTDYMFGDLEVPVGRFNASVTYRNDCNFRVDDAESLLSSRFMGVDDNFFKPTIGTRHHQHHRDPYSEVGSLPSQHRHGRGAQEPQQTYGSLGTFHGEGALGTSPISALKAVRPIGSDTSSPPASSAASVEQPEFPHSLPIRGAAARPPSLRNLDGIGRRPSVSFQPFKAGSLSGSPRFAEPDRPASPQSLTQRPGLGGIASSRNRTSLTAGMAASLRGNPSAAAALPADNTPPAMAGSPKPVSRYSSSFTHRRSRASFGGGPSRPDDDQASSGKQSLSSSVQPGSGLLAEIAGSSGSYDATDDDNISEFLKQLDSRKTLASFEPGGGDKSAAARRTAAQLSKFQMMRDSNNVLGESMTSSMHLGRSGSSSSRQIPPAAAPAAMSVSSTSPGTAATAGGKPMSSPHTPHTPAIPSRLSENSIIDYQAPREARRAEVVQENEDEEEEDQEEGGGARTTAIDIPLSPRLLHSGAGAAGAGSKRRPSLGVQGHRSMAAVGTGAGGVVDDDLSLGPGGEDGGGARRSISLGADGREAPTLSTLRQLKRLSTGGEAVEGGGVAVAEGAAQGAGSAGSASAGGRDGEASSASPGAVGLVGSGGAGRTPFRSRFGLSGPSSGSAGSGFGRAATPETNRGTSAFASLGGRYMAGASGRPVTSAAEDGADDEPLVFAMSELERPMGGRRGGDSNANAAGGGGAGGDGGGKGGAAAATAGSSSSSSAGGLGFEPRGTTRRGW